MAFFYMEQVSDSKSHSYKIVYLEVLSVVNKKWAKRIYPIPGAHQEPR